MLGGVTKEVEMSQHRLARELEKLRANERSEIRMIETERRRFRMKHGKLDFPKVDLRRTVSLAEEVGLGCSAV